MLRSWVTTVICLKRWSQFKRNVKKTNVFITISLRWTNWRVKPLSVTGLCTFLFKILVGIVGRLGLCHSGLWLIDWRAWAPIYGINKLVILHSFLIKLVFDELKRKCCFSRTSSGTPWSKKCFYGFPWYSAKRTIPWAL